MSAIIKTYLNGDPATLVEGASRDDLRPGDVVTCEASAAPGGEYRWTLAFAPMDEAGEVKSTATVDGQETNTQCSFTVDHEGAYLVRLIIDPGTSTESTQFVRLRFLTRFGSLKLVAAGERRDGSGIVPVDATTEGWANDQNYNLQELLHHISRTAISSRTVYVDANRGNDPSNGQNTEEAEGYADFWKIQDAIDFVVAGGHCGIPASPLHPWIIVVRPGLYRESLTIRSGVILWGEPSGALKSEVIVRTWDTDAQLPGVHHVELPAAGDMAQVFGIHFINFDAADTEGVIRVSGAADATFVLAGSWVEQRGNSATQGPCVGSLQPRLKILDSRLESRALTNSDRFVVTLSNADASIVDSDVQGASGISVDASSSIQVQKSRIRVEHPDASAAGIRTWGLTAILGTLIDVGESDGWAVDVNPTGTAGNRIMVSSSSLVSLSDSAKGGLRYNTNGVATPGAHLASVDLPPHRLVFDPPEFVDDARVVHGTTGESLFYKADKEIHTSSLSTGNLPADSVQQALDKLLDVAISVATLDDAYDGLLDHSTDPLTRGSGHGHQIVADATDELGRGIPVSIVDKTAPDDFAGAANTKGRLQVVSNVEVGAIDAPEITLDPNPFGAGPRVSFGKTVWPGGPHKAAAVVQAASDPVLGRHYHLRLQTQPSDVAGPGYIGSVIVQGGDSFGPADGGGVHIQAGSSTGGIPGSVFIASGEGSLVVAGSGSVGAVLTAANACADPVGLQEDLVLSTPAGSFTVSVNPGMPPAEVADAINLASAGSVTAVVTGGGELQLTTNATGPLADVLLVTASAELNTALGDLTAAAVTYVDGTYGDTFTMRTTDDNELTLGIGGAVGPMVFNADTGKLTVPGLIDPWGLIFSEVNHTLVDEAGIHPVQGEGGVFVSDGTDGLIDNHPHYRGEADGGGVEQDPLAFVLSDGTGNATEVAFWSADGVLGGNPDLWWDNTDDRLGVGLSAPLNKLHVETANDGDGVIFGNSGDGSKFVASYVAGSGMGLQLWDAGNTQAVMLRSYDPSWIRGWLGVGAATEPTSPLHVTGNVKVESGFGTLTLDVSNTYAGNMGLWADGTHLVVGSASSNDFFVFLNGLETLQLSRGASWTKYTSHGGGGTHSFSGNVGVGIDIPTEPLHVVGNGLFTGNLTVNGDLTVQGDTTTMNTATVLVEDKNIELGVIAGGGETDVSADGGGITLRGDTNKTITWDLATGAWHFNQGIDIQSPAAQLRVGSSPTEYATLGVDGAAGLVVESVGGPILVTSVGNLTLDAAASLNLNTQSNDAAHAINLGTENKPGPVNIATAGTRDLNLGTTTTITTVQGDPIAINSAGRISLDAAGYISVTSSAALNLETNSHTHDINLGAANKNSPINIGTGGTRTITMSNANSGVVINGPASGSGKALTVNGDVKITGVLDPTALVITHQADGPALAVGESSLWVDEAGAVKFFKRVLEEDASTGIADGLALLSELTTLQGTVDAMTATLPAVDGDNNDQVLTVVGGAWAAAAAPAGGSHDHDADYAAAAHNHDGSYLADFSTLASSDVLSALGGLGDLAVGGILKVVDVGGSLEWALGADDSGGAGHDHSGDPAYALAGHDHDAAYAAAGHDHDAAYAAAGHDHEGVYSLTGHVHDYIATSHPANGIDSTLIGNWNTAHGWGDHSAEGYLASFSGMDSTDVTSALNAHPGIADADNSLAAGYVLQVIDTGDGGLVWGYGAQSGGAGSFADIDHNHDGSYAAVAHDHGVDDLSDVRTDTPAHVEIGELFGAYGRIFVFRSSKDGATGNGDEIQFHQLADPDDPLLVEANGENLSIEYPALASTTIQNLIDGINAVEGWAALGSPPTDLTWILRSHPGGPGDTNIPLANGAATASPWSVLLYMAGEWVPSQRIAVTSLFAEDINFNGTLSMRGHIIPEIDNTVDIGSAGHAIRDLYVSENSLWVGDSHKVGNKPSGSKKFRKRKGKNESTSWIPFKLLERLQGFAEIPDSPVVKGPWPTPDDGQLIGFGSPDSVGDGSGVILSNVYADQDGPVRGYWLDWLLTTMAEMNLGEGVGEYANGTGNRSSWTLGDWWHVILRLSAAGPVFGVTFDHDADGVDSEDPPADIYKGLWLGPVPDTQLGILDDGEGGILDPRERNSVVRTLSDLFDDDKDFEGEADIIEVRQFLPAVDSLTTFVAEGESYVGIETQSAAVALGLPDDAVDSFNCVLPDTEAEGAVRGRRVIISNESDPASGDGNHFPITLQCGGNPMNDDPATGKISGMATWDIPMMTAMTLVCVGGEGVACKWFITGRS